MKNVYKIGLKKFYVVRKLSLYEFLPFGYSRYDLKEYKGSVKKLINEDPVGFIHEKNYKGDDETCPSSLYNSAREEHCRYQEATGIYESDEDELEGLDAYIKSCIRDSTLESILCSFLESI
mgnify:CR=1 FL=1